MPSPAGPSDQEGGLSDTVGPTETVDLDWRTVVAILAVVAVVGGLVALVAAAPGLVTPVVVAAFIALALNPLVRFTQRKLRRGRGPAVATVSFGALVLSLGVVFGFGPAVVEQAQALPQQLPEVLDSFTQLPIVGPALEENNVPQRLQEWLSDLPARLGSDESDLGGLVSTAGESLGTLVLIGVLALAFMLDGQHLADLARSMVPAGNRERIDRLSHLFYESVARYFTGSLLLAALYGVWVIITGILLGIPLTPLLAVWAALTALLPQIGGALGAALIGIVGLTAGPVRGLVMLGLFGAYLLFTNNVLLPIIIGRAVKISPPTTMLAAIGGFAAGGIPGSLFAVPIVGATKAIIIDVRAEFGHHPTGSDPPGDPDGESGDPADPGPLAEPRPPPGAT